ncbi:MAG: polyprenyl synthetase family protein [Saccharofermentans sp.]|nr:polyprenyl synthetase family protein [Saccharofermentans sp.]
MDTKKLLEEVLSWKKDDLDGVCERICIAIKETESHDIMQDLLLENAENKGKMLRSLVLIMAAGDYPAEKREEVLWGAAAGEMIHSASLLLDDIIDNAPLRRGKPSMQAKYGTSAAICSATFLMATAYSCLLNRGFEQDAKDLLKVTQLVCDGELLQDRNLFNTGISEDLYMQSIEGKTAVVFAFSARIGSGIAGYDQETQDLFSEFGKTMGMIFQMRDDVLDWTLSEKELGKPVCEDFLNGIYTLPTIYTFNDEKYGDELLAIAKKKGQITRDELERAKKLVVHSGGIDYAKDSITAQANKAFDLLGRLPDNRYISVLKSLINLLL